MKRQLHLDHLHRLVDKALTSGGVRVNMSRVRWDISGRCERPYVQEFHSVPSGDEHKHLPMMARQGRRKIVVKRYSMAPMTLEMHTPCRRCRTCKLQRQRLWAARAHDETRMSARTWFGTLTLRPEAWLHYVNQCRQTEALQGVDFDALPESERHALMHARIGAEVTKMNKRLRGLCPPGMLRFLVVLELTQNSVIHYHCLLHERSLLHPVRHKQLADAWPLGFSKWRLLSDPKEAGYVAKYLSKSLLARVRASEGYGTGESGTALSPSLDTPEGGSF